MHLGCNNWMPGTSAVWFKVHQQGRQGTSNSWAASPLMVPGNAGYSYTIPSCLKAGNYLVRHELIALHSAVSFFFPHLFDSMISKRIKP